MKTSNLTTTDRLKELLPQLFNTDRLQGNYYLRFQLTNEISASIALEYVLESLTIPGNRITAVPNLPEYVIGLMSSRNQVFLAMDLAHLAGLQPETINSRQYQTIVVKLAHSLAPIGDTGSLVKTNSIQNENSIAKDANLFGLTVKQIEGITRISSDRLSNTTDDIPEVLKPFVSQAIALETEDGNSSSENKQSLVIDIPKLIAIQVDF